MSKAVNYALMAVAVIFGLTVVWAVVSVRSATEEAAATPPAKVIEYSNNTLKEERNGRLVWEITADSSSLDISSQQTTLANAKGAFYRDDGSTLRVAAPRGVYDPQRKRVHLSGGVNAVASTGDTLTCDELDYDGTPGKSLIVAKGRAQLNHDGMTVNANKVTVKL